MALYNGLSGTSFLVFVKRARFMWQKYSVRFSSDGKFWFQIGKNR